MNKEEFYTQIAHMLPIRRTGHFEKMEYLDIVKCCFSSYKQMLESLSFQDVSWDKSHLFCYCEEIESSIELFYKGLISESFQKTRQVMRGRGNLPPLENHLRLSLHLLGADYYRIRRNSPNGYFSCQDMFHIPLNKRGIIQTQRYSIPGYPCLYLGDSIQGCWVEMHRPPLDSFAVARIHGERMNVFWDLRLPAAEEKIDAFQFRNLLYKLPLLIACSVEARYNPEDIYKPEYVIPQFLTQLILEFREHAKIEIKNARYDYYPRLDGIYYTSVHRPKDCPKNRIRRFDNVAIPIFRPLAISTHCPELCKMFSITNPIYGVKYLKDSKEWAILFDEMENDLLNTPLHCIPSE